MPFIMPGYCGCYVRFRFLSFLTRMYANEPIVRCTRDSIHKLIKCQMSKLEKIIVWQIVSNYGTKRSLNGIILCELAEVNPV